ncbi:MAG: branched-chain amino acid ABC transporter permease [Thermodesulfovibrionales bacterium]|nr:branched-chain amino acid ABC transporter permease [Thermodesulfovibrionales bacterium]
MENQGYRKKDILGLLVALIVLSFLPLLLPSENYKYLYDILFTLNIIILLSTSWNILGGFAGQVSFGHAGFVGMGAYAIALLHYHCKLSPWLIMPISGVAAVIGAMIIGVIALNLRGPYFALSTLALAEVTKLIVEGWREFTQGTQGIVVSQGDILGIKATGGVYFLITLWIAGFALLTAILIKQSRYNYYFLAVAENEDAAMAVGINSKRFKLYALLISAFFAGLAGGLIATHTGFVDPESGFDMVRTVEPIFITIVGGIGTIFGPVIGAILLVPIGEMLRSEFTKAHLLFYGVLLIIFARFLPHGIVGLLKRRFK